MEIIYWAESSKKEVRSSRILWLQFLWNYNSYSWKIVQSDKLNMAEVYLVSNYKRNISISLVGLGIFRFIFGEIEFV
jgi:hypothetical protein